MTYPRSISMPMGIVVISRIWPSNCLWAWVLILRPTRFEEKVYIFVCWCIQKTYPKFIDAFGYYCPSVRWFTTFSDFFAFAEKLLERNGINLGCWYVQITYPRQIVIPCIRPPVRPYMGFSLGVADKSLRRNGLHFRMLMYPGYLPSVCWRLWVLLSICLFYLLLLHILVQNKFRGAFHFDGTHQ